jgi:hypothetical protein
MDTYRIPTVLKSPKKQLFNHEVIEKVLYKLLENKRYGRGRETAQTPVESLLFRQDP